ncbi:MAG: protein translocase subunit SecD [Dehalococcoidia bacterium]|nr:protein translocase subunit SecD [Dehalococcoidia bacterium]
MHRTFDRILLAFIVLVAAFSLVTMWPSEPWHYLPGAIPWPEGQGIKIPFIKFDGTEVKGATLERRAMTLGLDLKGGTRLVLEPDLSNSPDVNLDDALNNASQIIERRINEFGVAESEIQRQGNRLAVQLPGITAEEAMQKIGRTALLEFRELKTDANGNVAVMVNGQEAFVPQSSVTSLDDAVWIQAVATTRDGQSVPLTGQYLKNARLAADPNTGLPLIAFEFNDEGAHLFEQITGRLLKQPLAFFLDGEPITTADGHVDAPIVQSVISDRGQITGMRVDEANNLVKLLNAGAFPVPLKVVQSENVDATLGQDSVQASVIAGETAMLVIMLFMVLYYRLPGLIASVALSVYATIVLAVFKLLPVTLTLSGIAAFVLSVGMAVDANVLIFERMKEELRIGRSLVVAMEEGFHRAWSSIRDSNVSTLITCAILYWFGDQFGASLVKGFALTLAIGVFISMFSAILVTRTFLRIVVSIPAARKPALWVSHAGSKDDGGSREPASLPTGGGG